MQLVSKEILAELAKHSSKIHESDFSDPNKIFSFSDFNTAFQKQIDLHGVMSAFKTMNTQYLPHFCPPIRFVGEGSSRAAYAMDNGLCLKVAKNDKGQAQNLQEYKMTKNPRYSCFAQTFECEKSGNSVLTECCAMGNEQDFHSKCQGKFTLNVFCDVVSDLCDTRKMSLETLSDDIKRRRDSSTNTFVKNSLSESLECISWILENKCQQAKVLNEICRFYSENSDNDLLVGDLMNIDNWGLAVRDEEMCFIIIDAGLSGDVYDKYYA